MKPKALIFDLDGTLAETAPDIHRVLETLMREEGIACPPLHEVRTMVGEGARALIGKAHTRLDLPLSEDNGERLFERFLTLYEAEPCIETFAFDGVEAFLGQCRTIGTLMGVCTNKPQRASELVVEGLGLSPYIASVVGGDALAVRKPDPAHIDAVLGELGAERRDAIMIGDSETDLRAARAASIPCVLVDFGYTRIPARDLGADAVIGHFSELADAIDRL